MRLVAARFLADQQRAARNRTNNNSPTPQITTKSEILPPTKTHDGFRVKAAADTPQFHPPTYLVLC